MKNEIQPQSGIADGTSWKLQPIKNGVIFKHESKRAIPFDPSEFVMKSRGDRLAEALHGRYTGRYNAYVLSPTKALKLIELLNNGWDAGAITGELRPPVCNP